MGSAQTMANLQPLFTGLRMQAGALRAAGDPHAELLALVWGPRFDREHAQALLAFQQPPQSAALDALRAAADSFDSLPAPRQQRLRRLIVRHGRGGWDNPPHAAHSPD
jgi:hypothetical protein